jgi:hypothetical protein
MAEELLASEEALEERRALAWLVAEAALAALV